MSRRCEGGRGHEVTAAVLLALLSALCYGTASALQHQATGRAADQPTMSMGLLARLVRDPGWLAGNGLDVTAADLPNTFIPAVCNQQITLGIQKYAFRV